MYVQNDNLFETTWFLHKIILTITNQTSAFGDTIEEHNEHCRFTVSGPKRNGRCKFPFKLGNNTYDTCTDYKVFLVMS